MQVCNVQFAANAIKCAKRTLQSEQISDFGENGMARASRKSSGLWALGCTKKQKNIRYAHNW